MDKINYQAWALYENLDVFTASALWCDRNPYVCTQWEAMEYIEVRNLVLHILRHQLDAESYPEEKRNFVIMELAKRFDKGINEFLQECKKFVLSRTQLKAIAEKSGVKPKFLFENDSYLNNYSIINTESESNREDAPRNDKPHDDPKSLGNESKQTTIKTITVASVFSEFKDLRANEISLVMMENRTAKIVIRGKSIKVNPDELGLKAGSQDWKMLEGAAVHSGDLTQTLRRKNKTTDLEAERCKIKTAVSRLRKSLKDAMGLLDNPIIYTNKCGYKFTFKTMAHELLKDGNVSKGGDAMDYTDDKCFDDNQHGNSSDWDEDE